MSLEERANREIELIEEDETLTPKEKKEAISEIIEEYREALSNPDKY